MNEILENLKEILESEASLLIEDSDDMIKLSEKDNHFEKKIVDHRFEHLKQIVDSAENKSDIFYTELIRVISVYVNQLYDRVIDSDTIILREKNRELSEQLFDYVCSILESNKDIKLDTKILQGLFNRSPKQISFSVEDNYIYRTFDFGKLIKILNQNQTLEKSNIGIDETYQLLLDTCQLNNEDVFVGLVKPEQFNQNHRKIDEILMGCNAKVFVEITNIIRRNFDKNFDRFSIAKKRNENKFCERLIFELLFKLSQYRAGKEDCDFIHQILTDSEIEIDYDLYSADYIGESDLRSIIALNGNKTIIKVLLSKEENVQNYYSHGDYDIQLYMLYAIIGEYEKAFVNFEELYNFEDDLDDEDKNWNKLGYAYGDWGYGDSIARFISYMCVSFKEDCVDYSVMIESINRILNSENVKYINLQETLTPIQEILSPEDFKLLVDSLVERHNSGNLGFLVVRDHKSMFSRYVISMASEDEVQDQLNSFNKKKKVKF